jgi:hypothetical protein
MTTWTGEGGEPIARPLRANRAAQTQNNRTNIHASNGIRTHDRSVSAGEDNYALDRAACVIGTARL